MSADPVNYVRVQFKSRYSTLNTPVVSICTTRRTYDYKLGEYSLPWDHLKRVMGFRSTETLKVGQETIPEHEYIYCKEPRMAETIPETTYKYFVCGRWFLICHCSETSKGQIFHNLDEIAPSFQDDGIIKYNDGTSFKNVGQLLMTELMQKYHKQHMEENNQESADVSYINTVVGKIPETGIPSNEKNICSLFRLTLLEYLNMN